MAWQRPSREPEEGASSATLGYGILVNVHTLIVAAKAFVTFSIDAHSLDLILSRRSRALPILSTLSPPPNVSLQGLPIEVLLLIRQQILQLHLDATPNALFAAHDYFWEDSAYAAKVGADFSHCECILVDGIRCSCSDAQKEGRQVAAMLRDASKWGSDVWERHDSPDFDDCLECGEELWNARFMHRDDLGCSSWPCDGGKCKVATVGQIRWLLRGYGLSLPTTNLILDDYTKGRDALIAILLSVRASPTYRNKARPPLDSAHSYLSPSAVPIPEWVSATSYDQSVFAVTPADNDKFLRLARDLRLDVAQPEAGGGGTVSRAKSSKEVGGLVDTEGAERVEEDARDEKEEVEETPVKPVFMLLHVATPWYSG